MTQIFFLLVWPILRRYLTKRVSEYTAGRAAGFLNRRREQRLKSLEEELQTSAEEIEACPPCSPTQIGYSPGDVFWFTLSGVFLGSALGVLLSYLTRQED
jgi:hypothetical protein